MTQLPKRMPQCAKPKPVRGLSFEISCAHEEVDDLGEAVVVIQLRKILWFVSHLQQASVRHTMGAISSFVGYVNQMRSHLSSVYSVEMQLRAIFPSEINRGGGSWLRHTGQHTGRTRYIGVCVRTEVCAYLFESTPTGQQH